MTTLLNSEILTNLILVIVGLVIGYGIGRVVKGALIVIAGLFLLTLLSASILLPRPIEEIVSDWSVPLEVLKFLTDLVFGLPTLTIGVIIGFILGLIK
ncbi:MAG: hypothetical protein NZ920_05025 [Aigarchaeota archaeon]|nr:hypothetical protein [Aigarchaeota archaeon]MDW8093297.1 hypothetical protein [Nitrososphaerota archaeon]